MMDYVLCQLRNNFSTFKVDLSSLYHPLLFTIAHSLVSLVLLCKL
jgi:hypothetical protein